MDAHAREYAAAAAGMRDTYGFQRQTHAVGDSIWVRLPIAQNTHVKVVVVEVLDDDLYHVTRHIPGGGREHYAVTPDEIMPF
jgi:hypothetical protein